MVLTVIEHSILQYDEKLNINSELSFTPIPISEVVLEGDQS